MLGSEGFSPSRSAPCQYSAVVAADGTENNPSDHDPYARTSTREQSAGRNPVSHREQSDIGVKEEGSQINIAAEGFLDTRNRVSFHGFFVKGLLQSGGVLDSGRGFGQVFLALIIPLANRRCHC